jgi:hypothetical protein
MLCRAALLNDLRSLTEISLSAIVKCDLTVV